MGSSGAYSLGLPGLSRLPGSDSDLSCVILQVDVEVQQASKEVCLDSPRSSKQAESNHSSGTPDENPEEQVPSAYSARGQFECTIQDAKVNLASVKFDLASLYLTLLNLVKQSQVP